MLERSSTGFDRTQQKLHESVSKDTEDFHHRIDQIIKMQFSQNKMETARIGTVRSVGVRRRKGDLLSVVRWIVCVLGEGRGNHIGQNEWPSLLSMCWEFSKTADATGAGAICGGRWTIPGAFCEDTIC